MTAINVIVGSDRVTLYTDGAGIDPTGRIRRIASKVRELPDMRCAIATRGHAGALGAAAAVLPRLAGDYDGLRAAVKAGGLRGARWRHPSLLLPFDLVVVGWSASGPAAFLVSNHGLHGFRAWKVVRIPQAVITPPVALSIAERTALIENMRAIMDRQREHLEPSRLVPAGRAIVGGFAERTTVMAAGVSRREMWRWPDAVGESIGGGREYRSVWKRLAMMHGAIFALTFAARIFCSLL